MINYLKKTIPFALAILIFSSCAESNSTEQAQIKTMDSTAKAAKETADKIAVQTSKVEASLEKLDSEFKENN
jgi:hypothetical protein